MEKRPSRLYTILIGGILCALFSYFLSQANNYKTEELVKEAEIKLHQKEENAKICELNILEVSVLESAVLRDRFKLNPDKKYDKVKIELETGRTHQIRAQLHYLGSPIVGDILYGGDSNPRLSLQASCIEFINPFTQIMQKFTLESVQEL